MLYKPEACYIQDHENKAGIEKSANQFFQCGCRNIKPVNAFSFIAQHTKCGTCKHQSRYK